MTPETSARQCWHWLAATSRRWVGFGCNGRCAPAWAWPSASRPPPRSPCVPAREAYSNCPASSAASLAIMPFNYLLQAAGYDCLFLHSKAFIGPVADRPLARVGIGDTTYTIGLFQLVA